MSWCSRLQIALVFSSSQFGNNEKATKKQQKSNKKAKEASVNRRQTKKSHWTLAVFLYVECRWQSFPH